MLCRSRSEVEVMKKVGDVPHVVHLHDWYETQRHLFFVMELCQGELRCVCFRGGNNKVAAGAQRACVSFSCHAAHTLQEESFSTSCCTLVCSVNAQWPGK